jgi:hypothetical protein
VPKEVPVACGSWLSDSESLARWSEVVDIGVRTGDWLPRMEAMSIAEPEPERERRESCESGDCPGRKKEGSDEMDIGDIGDCERKSALAGSPLTVTFGW